MITDVKRIGDASGTKVGARRVLNDAFQETLHALGEDDRRIRYRVGLRKEATAGESRTSGPSHEAQHESLATSLSKVSAASLIPSASVR